MPGRPKHKYQRLVGLDLARAAAIIGMVFVNFIYVFSQQAIREIQANEAALEQHSAAGIAAVVFVLVLLAGRAAAVFLVLFGIGMMLQLKRAGYQFRSDVLAPLLKRYAFLILGGLLFAALWDADILHYIGLYGLLALWMTKLRGKWLIVLTVVILAAAELLRHFFDYNAGWTPGAIGLSYADMWSVGGYFRQMFFNGFHPVFPWLAFVTYGMALGRCEIGEKKIQTRMIAGGLCASVFGFTLKALEVPAEFFPPHTLFILLGMANATWVIGLCLTLMRIQSVQGLLRPLANMGRLALSHYVGHVILGIVPVMIWTDDQMDLSFEASLIIAIVYLAVTLVLGSLWLRRHLQGPLEWGLRRISKAELFVRISRKKSREES